MMDGDNIDRRLRAALRHAPDGDLVPPPSLDRSILAAARLAVAPPRRPWRDWFERLLQPTAAGALATVAVATLIGALWHGDVPPEVASRTEPSVLAAPPVPAGPQATDLGTGMPTLAAVQPAPPIGEAGISSKVAPAAKHARESRQAAVVDRLTSNPGPTVSAPPAQGQALPARSDGRDAAVSQARAVSGLADRPAAPALTTSPASAVAAVALPPVAADAASSGGAAVAESKAEPPPSPAGGASANARFAAAAPVQTAPAESEVPPVVELLHAASSPWERQPADRMPAGGMLLRDATGQAVIGRVVIEGNALWWQPWTSGQAAQHALRAAISVTDARALQQRWPTRLGLVPGK